MGKVRMVAKTQLGNRGIEEKLWVGSVGKRKISVLRKKEKIWVLSEWQWKAKKTKSREGKVKGMQGDSAWWERPKGTIQTRGGSID